VGINFVLPPGGRSAISKSGAFRPPGTHPQEETGRLVRAFRQTRSRLGHLRSVVVSVDRTPENSGDASTTKGR
jgi:hypothetical protein